MLFRMIQTIDNLKQKHEENFLLVLVDYVKTIRPKKKEIPGFLEEEKGSLTDQYLLDLISELKWNKERLITIYTWEKEIKKEQTISITT